MQIIIKGELKDLSITSVILNNDLDDPEGRRLKMFFCFNCQNPILQYTGFVARILPGNIPVDLPLHLSKCHNNNCRHLYRFESII